MHACMHICICVCVCFFWFVSRNLNTYAPNEALIHAESSRRPAADMPLAVRVSLPMGTCQFAGPLLQIFLRRDQRLLSTAFHWLAACQEFGPWQLAPQPRHLMILQGNGCIANRPVGIFDYEIVFNSFTASVAL